MDEVTASDRGLGDGASPECTADAFCVLPEGHSGQHSAGRDGASPVRDDRTRPSTFALTTALYRIPGAGDRAAARAELAALDGLWSELARVQAELERWRAWARADAASGVTGPTIPGGLSRLPTKREMGVDAPDFGPTLGASGVTEKGDGTDG